MLLPLALVRTFIESGVLIFVAQLFTFINYF